MGTLDYLNEGLVGALLTTAATAAEAGIKDAAEAAAASQTRLDVRVAGVALKLPVSPSGAMGLVARVGEIRVANAFRVQPSFAAPLTLPAAVDDMGICQGFVPGVAADAATEEGTTAAATEDNAATTAEMAALKAEVTELRAFRSSAEARFAALEKQAELEEIRAEERESLRANAPSFLFKESYSE
jgi:hypothetical protein